MTVLFNFLFVFFIIFPKKWSRYYNSHILDDISINHLILLGSEYILYSFFKLTSEALRRWLCLYDKNRRWHAVNGSAKQRNEIWIKYWKWNSAYLVIHTVLQLLFRGPKQKKTFTSNNFSFILLFNNGDHVYDSSCSNFKINKLPLSTL